MGQTGTFAEILEFFIDENSPTSLGSNPFINSHSTESLIYGFSQILGTTPTYSFQQSRGYPRRPIPSKPAHLFTDQQLDSYNYFLNLGHALNKWFNLRDLKSIYRKELLKSHPDHGGSSEKFQEVRKHYQILLALVTTKT